jgi:indole-3-glycerol phosphate synthase
MSTILDKILATKREEIVALKATFKSKNGRELYEQCQILPPTRGFRAALESPPSPPIMGGIALIAEVKKASPSKGIIREDFDPVQIAKDYEAGGASCLSVLTDKTYFQGDLAYLTQIREAVKLPLLRKDFVLEPIQIYEARVRGADAILLIVAAIPSPARLAELRHVTESIGMDALVEVHNQAELEVALQSGATLIGVNNRDLHTFNVDIALAETLIPTFPQGVIGVAESGIFTHADALRMQNAGAKAILVGESLMREADIVGATKRLIG